VEIALSTFRLNLKLSSLFWLDTSVDIAITGQLYDIKLIQLVYF
jgi:hypothetical protein